jgi:hypothetical protein
MVLKSSDRKEVVRFQKYPLVSLKIVNRTDQILEEKKVVNLKVWIDDNVVYHSKIEQKATMSSMNKLCAIRKPTFHGKETVNYDDVVAFV